MESVAIEAGFYVAFLRIYMTENRVAPLTIKTLERKLG